MKFKLLAVAVALFSLISGANAEISTFIKSVSDKTVKLPDGMQCFVKSRAIFGGGDKSPFSEYFAESGLLVASDKNAPCTIAVGGNVSVPLNTKTHEDVRPMSIEFLLTNEFRKSLLLSPALQATSLEQEAKEQDKVPHTIGSNTGAIIGASIGGVATSGALAMFGALFDGKKKKLPEGIATIYADLEYKDEQGNSHETDIVIYAASTTEELPIDLIRAAIKRVVAEIQTKTPTPEVVETQAQPEPQDSTGTSAQAEILTPEVH